MHRFIILFAVGAVVCGCNNRSRGSTTTDPLCPTSTVSTGELCDEGQAGIMCSGTVRCPCGTRPTTCGCSMGASGYSFQCVDSCSCPSAGDAGGVARCGAVYDRIQASACPYPPDFMITRDDLIRQCGDIAAMSEACRAAIDVYISCYLSETIECVDVGDGQLIATVPACSGLDTSCMGG